MFSLLTLLGVFHVLGALTLLHWRVHMCVCGCCVPGAPACCVLLSSIGA